MSEYADGFGEGGVLHAASNQITGGGEMSEYADGFDDGKGEKFDELMEEIASLREQLKECSAAFDKQQEQLDRNAGQIATLREALSRLIEVHDAMGGMCSPERILAEAALLGKDEK